MSNPKTLPARPPKPVPHNGWVQKCDLDAYLDRHLPIPTQVVSNEEYSPLPQTNEQKPGAGPAQVLVGYGADGAVTGENSRPEVRRNRHHKPDRTHHSRG